MKKVLTLLLAALFLQLILSMAGLHIGIHTSKALAAPPAATNPKEDTLPPLNKWKRERYNIQYSEPSYSNGNLVVKEYFTERLRYTSPSTKNAYVLEYDVIVTTTRSAGSALVLRVSAIDSDNECVILALSRSIGEVPIVLKEPLTLHLEKMEIVLATKSSSTCSKGIGSSGSSSIGELNEEIKVMIKDFLRKDDLDYADQNMLVTARALRKARIDMLRAQGKSHGLYVAGSYTPSFAYRVLNNSIQGLNNYAATDRDAADRNIYGDALELNLGFKTNGNHHVYLSGFRQWMGFQSFESQLVNWKTGVPEGDKVENVIYRFRQVGVGIGYRYVGYSYMSLVSAIFDINVYYARIKEFHTEVDSQRLEREDNLRELHLRPNQLGARLGLGIALRFNHSFDVYFMPTFNTNLTGISYGSSTRISLYNLGLQIGGHFRFVN